MTGCVNDSPQMPGTVPKRQPGCCHVQQPSVGTTSRRLRDIIFHNALTALRSQGPAARALCRRWRRRGGAHSPYTSRAHCHADRVARQATIDAHIHRQAQHAASTRALVSRQRTGGAFWKGSLPKVRVACTGRARSAAADSEFAAATRR